MTIASNGVNPALFPGMARRWLAALAVALAVGGLIAIYMSVMAWMLLENSTWSRRGRAKPCSYSMM